MDGTSAKSVAHLVPVERMRTISRGCDTVRMFSAHQSRAGIVCVPAWSASRVPSRGRGFPSCQAWARWGCSWWAGAGSASAPQQEVGTDPCPGTSGPHGWWSGSPERKRRGGVAEPGQNVFADQNKSPDDGFVRSHLMRFIGPMEKVAVDVPQQAFSLMDHSLKQTA